MNKVVGKAELPITDKMVENVIVTGLEGGINYWAGLDNSALEGKPKGEPISLWVAKILLDGGSVKLYDVEEEEEDSEWFLTLEKLINGISQNMLKRPWDSSIEKGDATTADCIIQYALFNEIVYA